MKSVRSTSQHASRVFQDLHHADSRKQFDENAESRHFKPMFQAHTGNGAAHNFETTQDQQINETDPLEQARSQGHQKGMLAGKQSACQLVQNELSPVIESFIGTIKACDVAYRRCSERFSQNSSKLALDIVQKICGAAPNLALDDMAELQRTICRTMENAYRFNIQINPDDIELFKELSHCDDHLVWEQYAGVSVQQNSAITSGQIQCSQNDAQWEALGHQVADLIKGVIQANRLVSDDASQHHE